MSEDALLKLTLPKGRIQDRVLDLMNRAGLAIRSGSRSYRPSCADQRLEVKILKPQNIPRLISLGRHDCGFTGHDWLVEQGVADSGDVVELLDLGFDPVRIVVAVPESLVAELDTIQKQRPLIVASEYRQLAERYIAGKKLNAVYVQTYGATEALPPEDADMIIDNTATGATLKMNRLHIQDEVLRSTTRFVASREAMENPAKRALLDELVTLFKSVLEAQSRVLLEMNVPPDQLESVVAMLPSMRSPTVAPLYGETGYAVKVAVPAADTAVLIPKLLSAGARDILEYRLEKIVV